MFEFGSKPDRRERVWSLGYEKRHQAGWQRLLGCNLELYFASVTRKRALRGVAMRFGKGEKERERRERDRERRERDKERRELDSE